ncbi:divergent polysaccharide deacetylase family protein [Desulforamulus aquiferis]|uniref:Divergent polysaccharide deacetylase family protein n=1 Tax=Desulforamulus aquiferis TaxID=1397668 RepID=A0AAW7ZET3_9FIRM|nr:divergent polysaccharide deacetylase family protein [Desulforamulus aquiferis]MDO7787664.1 divergent polysaccharide deacetylase family protein [Desulforamulus aquiferis]
MLKRYLKYIILIGLLVTIGYLGITGYLSTSRETVSVSRPIMAIVIDDFGGADCHGVEQLLTLDRPITAAVMPNLTNSLSHSEMAHKNGHEVILHQPMEPVKGKLSWLGPGAITSAMTQDEIKETFINNLDTVPHAIGFNNHTGSKITSQRDKILPMLEVAKDKGLYVLDSRTSMKSQIMPVAKTLGVASVKRDIFLDDVKSDQHISKQFRKACKVAHKQGYAIVIGHVGQGGNVTARSVKAAIPMIEKEGIKIVPLSEVVQRNSDKNSI